MKRKIVMGVCIGCMVMGGIWCGRQTVQTSGGTGSELVGTACYPKAPVPGPVTNARVYVFDETYLADTSASFQAQWTVETDKNGEFRVDGLSSGTYVIEIVDSTGSSIAARAALLKGRTVSLDTLFVTRPGSIKIPLIWAIPGIAGAGWYVRVYGTRLIARGPVDSSGVFIDHVPTGVPLSINLTIANPLPMSLDFNGIVAAPDSTKVLPALLLNAPLSR